MTNTYRTKGVLSVTAESYLEAAWRIALRMARRAYGTNAVVGGVGMVTCSDDGLTAVFAAYLALPLGVHETIGHPVQFTINKGPQ